MSLLFVDFLAHFALRIGYTQHMITKVQPVLLCLLGLAAVPLAAQTVIGGGTCNSASLNGNYAMTLAGRKVAPSGTFAGVFQAAGSVQFDGQSKATVTLTANTNQALSTPMNSPGTYIVQADCTGTVTIVTGAGLTLNLILYNHGSDFTVTGSDSSYVYSGSGSTLTATCAAATLTGVYTMTVSGYNIASGAVSGAANGTGSMQFDGKSGLTVSLTLAAIGSPATPVSMTGTYTIGANCLGMAAVTDAKGNSYTIGFSVTNASAANGTADVTLALSSQFILSGAIHAVYGQPTAILESIPAAGLGVRS